MSPAQSEAVLSSCESYRYTLGRAWAGGEESVCFVMLNPSTASATVDDPTIRRCIGYAKRWGFASLEVVNLFALRATDPNQLWRVSSPVGAENDRYIERALRRNLLVVCAWGVPKWSGVLERADRALRQVRAAGKQPHALKLSKEGFPCHPLYLPNGLIPRPFDRTGFLP